LELRALLPKLPERMQASQLLGNADYDAEWVHEWCRDRQGVENWIPPVVHREDGKVGRALAESDGCCPAHPSPQPAPLGACPHLLVGSNSVPGLQQSKGMSKGADVARKAKVSLGAGSKSADLISILIGTDPASLQGRTPGPRRW